MPIAALPTTTQATAKTTLLAGGAGMARALELTDEQKAAFREVLEPHRTKMQSLRDKMRQNHQALEAALEGDDPDPAAVGKIAIEGRTLRKQAEAHRAQMNQALREFLTPEQQTKLDVLESMRRRGPRFGPGGPALVGPGGPPLAWPENGRRLRSE